MWLSPLRLSLLCSFFILSSQEKVKQMRISHFQLSLVLSLRKKPRTLDVLWSISISTAINCSIQYQWKFGSVQQQHHATLSHIPSTFISFHITHVGLEISHFLNQYLIPDGMTKTEHLKFMFKTFLLQEPMMVSNHVSSHGTGWQTLPFGT